jgi:hypothetical protein
MKKFVFLLIMIISAIVGISQNLKIKGNIIDNKGNQIESDVYLYEVDSLIHKDKTSELNYKLKLNKDYYLIIENNDKNLTKIINFNTNKAKKGKYKFEFLVIIDDSLRNFGGLVYYNTSKQSFDYIVLK